MSLTKIAYNFQKKANWFTDWLLGRPDDDYIRMGDATIIPAPSQAYPDIAKTGLQPGTPQYEAYQQLSKQVPGLPISVDQLRSVPGVDEDQLKLYPKGGLAFYRDEDMQDEFDRQKKINSILKDVNKNKRNFPDAVDRETLQDARLVDSYPGVFDQRINRPIRTMDEYKKSRFGNTPLGMRNFLEGTASGIMENFDIATGIPSWIRGEDSAMGKLSRVNFGDAGAGNMIEPSLQSRNQRAAYWGGDLISWFGAPGASYALRGAGKVGKKLGVSNADAISDLGRSIYKNPEFISNRSRTTKGIIAGIGGAGAIGTYGMMGGDGTSAYANNTSINNVSNANTPRVSSVNTPFKSDEAYTNYLNEQRNRNQTYQTSFRNDTSNSVNMKTEVPTPQRGINPMTTSMNMPKQPGISQQNKNLKPVGQPNTATNNLANNATKPFKPFKPMKFMT